METALGAKWASDEEWKEHVAEIVAYGTAMCRVGTDGLTRHVPRHEWSVFDDPPSPMTKDGRAFHAE